jgi:hypothetical protein
LAELAPKLAAGEIIERLLAMRVVYLFTDVPKSVGA